MEWSNISKWLACANLSMRWLCSLSFRFERLELIQIIALNFVDTSTYMYHFTKSKSNFIEIFHPRRLLLSSVYYHYEKLNYWQYAQIIFEQFIKHKIGNAESDSYHFIDIDSISNKKDWKKIVLFDCSL